MYTTDSLFVYTLIFVGCALTATLVLITCLVALGTTMQWVFKLLNILDEPLPHPTLDPIQKMLSQASKRGQRWYLRTEGGRLVDTNDGEIDA